MTNKQLQALELFSRTLKFKSKKSGTVFAEHFLSLYGKNREFIE